jgi:hypothetical protein
MTAEKTAEPGGGDCNGRRVASAKKTAETASDARNSPEISQRSARRQRDGCTGSNAGGVYHLVAGG